MLLSILQQIPEGYSEGWYDGRKYGLSKTVFNHGKSFKLFAEELGGNDYISLNYYITSSSELLKPCEMPEKKVVDFLQKLVLA